MRRLIAFGTLAALAALWLGGCAAGSFAPARRARADESALAPQSPNVVSPVGPIAVNGDRSRTPGSLLAALAPTDELWIVERSDPNLQVRHSEDDPGAGAMLAREPETAREVPLPLKHTDVHARIAGYIATVGVTQQFHNPYNGKIEAVYVFPLPHDAAVNEFVMTIGDRRIRGIIRERDEARRIYDAAKHAGHAASLLSQERPNIFTQSVANLEPGKAIDVAITYFHTLDYRDGAYEFVFPMVVGPRFNPPGTAGGVDAVAHGDRGASGQPTTVPYLAPDERSGHDISLRAEIDAGVALEEVACASHAVATESPAPGRAVVTLSRSDSLPNRDFVLRYRVAGKVVKSALVTQRDARGGFFTLMLVPPDDPALLPRRPVELIFVLDCSGSMSGAPLAKATTALERALRRLEPDDTFQIIRFSDSASALGAAPLPATPENVRRGIAHARALQSEGGTMMLEGIRAALGAPPDPARLRVVSFMTDGFIGNELEIFGEVHRLRGDARIFSFGVGTSVNRYLLEGLARLGRGAVAYVGLDDSAGREVDLFYERLRRPALTDIALDWGGLQVTDVYPRRVPDLFPGRPVTLTGRFTGDPAAAPIRVTGRAADGRGDFGVTLAPETSGATHAGIPCVWARAKLAELSDFAAGPDPGGERADEARKLALEFGLVSSHTSFIAVDASRTTDGAFGTTVQQGVPVPEGVKYETTVKERR